MINVVLFPVNHFLSNTEWCLLQSTKKRRDISLSNVDDVTHISFVTPEFICLDNKQWVMKVDHSGNIF